MSRSGECGGLRRFIGSVILVAVLNGSYVERIGAQPSPVCLVNYESTLYRVNRTGTGAVEAFTAPGVIIAMTVVPEGVTVTGCVAGDVLAFETGPNRVWRIDNARSGTPILVEIGNREPDGVSASIAFADGHLYGIQGNAVFKEYDPLTFAVIGTPIDLSSVTTVGGFAFDGDSRWYVCTTTRLAQVDDPPTPTTWSIITQGLPFGGTGVEMYEGDLWAGVRHDSGQMIIGTFDIVSGAFTEVWEVAGTSDASHVGFVALAPHVQHGDANCDGGIDGTDIQAFVMAMLDPAGYVSAFPDCHVLNCDVNGDNAVDAADVSSFVQCLLNECP